jgi:large subunit ribosomal protein L10
MTKEQKFAVVEELAARFQEYPNFYVADTTGMTVAQINTLRRECFSAGIPVQVVKNTLIIKAIEKAGLSDYAEAYPALKQTSALFFTTVENASAPAKVIKAFRDKQNAKETPKPALKAACIDASVFIGDDQLEALTKLKTKQELIGEIIGLLQSPAKNVVSALQSGGNKLAGIVKTLSER